ncbi:MAG: glyoxalase [Anaerolineales bacterium]|nr:glyoxalase [Anaerolineae bacterium]PWB49497.1 MAG: glyoxalase [Anaerolineales bacterium]
MNEGIRTVIYPVKDLNRAKKMFSRLLDTQPYVDEPYYVGYRIDGQEIGLDPNGDKDGHSGPIDYYHVDDIRKHLQILLDGGSERVQEIKDVGGGKLIASVRGPEGNIIGLIQMPKEMKH